MKLYKRGSVKETQQKKKVTDYEMTYTLAHTKQFIVKSYHTRVNTIISDSTTLFLRCFVSPNLFYLT